MPKQNATQLQIASCAESRKVKSCAECLRYNDKTHRGCPYKVGFLTPFPVRAMLSTVTPEQLHAICKACSEKPNFKATMKPLSPKEARFLSNPDNFPFSVFLQTPAKRRTLQAIAVSYSNGRICLSEVFEPVSEIVREDPHRNPPQNVLQLCYETMQRC